MRSAKCCDPVLRTAGCPAILAGPIAVRSTQFGGVTQPLTLLARGGWQLAENV
jgi:hypothetical protein